MGGQPLIEEVAKRIIYHLDPEYETKCAKLKLHEYTSIFSTPW